MKKSVSKNLVYNLIYQILTILLPLVTTPYLSRVLGAEKIGIYGYTLSITTYFVLLGSLGVTLYGQREIAKYQDDINKYSKAFYEIIVVRTIAIILSILIFYLLFCINNINSLYYKIFLLYIVSAAFDISWFFQGVEDFSKTVIRNIIVKFLSIILIFAFVRTINDLWLYVLIFVLGELIGNVSLWFYLPKYVKRISFKKLNLKTHIRPIAALFIPQIATQVYTVLDKTMVGVITNDMNEVGFYEQAQKIARAALVIVAAMQTVINSRVSNAHHKQNKKEIIENLRKGFDYVWFISIPLTFGLIAVSNNLVPWYYGKGFEKVGYILMAISPMIIVIGLSGITGIVYLVQTNQSKVFTKSVILGSAVNVILNLILIKTYRAIGAAIASIIAELSILIYHLFYIKKIYKIKDIFLASIKCLLSGVVMFGIVFYISFKLKSSITNTLILTAVGGIIYIMLLFILKYDNLYMTIDMIKNKFMRGKKNEKV